MIRESAKTRSKTIARDAERARRRDFELAINGISRRERPPLLSVAAQQWLDSRAGLAPVTLVHYRLYAKRIVDYFGQRLVSDIAEEDIAGVVRTRQHQGLKPRRINFEVAVLRMVLRYFGLWESAKGRFRPLREPHDVGRAINRGDEEKIISAASASRSPALLPLFIIAIDTGLRANELSNVRHGDLTLGWHDGAIAQGWLRVSKSKTAGGTGRTIPLTRRACAVLSLWISKFPDTTPETYLFPCHKVGFVGNTGKSDIYAVQLSRPMGSWKKSWRHALETADLRYRWHDLRHSFISRLAENPAVSEQTIMSLAGHVSKAMLARYSHIRSAAKLAAIQALEQSAIPPDRAQNWAQSDVEIEPMLPN